MKTIIPLLFALVTILASCDKQADEENASTSIQELADAFPNKKLTFWDQKESYELHLYGDLAYIHRINEGSPKYLCPIDTERFMSIWKGFHALPQLNAHKNSDPLTTKSRDTHVVVFLNDVAGLDIGPGRYSYSIPRDVSSDSYIEWGESVKGVIAEYLSEQVAASDR